MCFSSSKLSIEQDYFAIVKMFQLVNMINVCAITLGLFLRDK
jgi:hypothetical protein